jgi:hypothetical protein
MAKRMTYEQKKDQSIIDLINKMFEIAGHAVTYDDIKDRKDDWFTEYTMTVEQSDEWKEWGEKYLKKKLNLSAKRAEMEMSWASLAWGLKFSNWDEYYKTAQDADTEE